MTNTPYPTPLWMTEGDDKRAGVKKMFAQIATRYDLLNSLFCFRLHYRWRSHAAQALKLNPGDTVLDLCCGTGSFVEPLSRQVGTKGKVVGLDFCLPMLQVAANRRAANPRAANPRAANPRAAKARFALGDALKLPLASESLDGVSVGWGIRNLVDVDAGHREIFRVLKSGKRFVSVDMAQPQNSTIDALSKRLFLTVVPALAKLLGSSPSAYLYLPKSTENFKSREQLVASMSQAGFTQVGWKNLMLGNVCIHWGLKP
jgi:demethylmenaquinone methyltransferase/2-methoxy-6-polyprenyl-1,4-benzoquinol methylase